MVTHVAHIAKASDCKVSDGSNLETVSPKKTLQKLSTALAQVKAGNTCENLLDEIRQIIYSLQRAKEIIIKRYAII